MLPLEKTFLILCLLQGEHINLERFYRHGGEKAQLEAAP